ncbi:MAG TPA: class I SAM-dependent methyltransferase [Ohtaekwangia sp.]|nr:class I SAM-dependent methyltransferase [Ohtaekwangia sp.]
METQSVADSYNAWSASYDEDLNATRDMEAAAVRELLAGRRYKRAVEAGCGTGKNTIWLADQSDELVCMDVSAGMLARAREKMTQSGVSFIQTDLTKVWPVDDALCDLVVFSLVLEHIREFRHVFAEAFRCLCPGGVMYIGELHPFRQYQGGKARFETNHGVHEVTCYTHHVSAYVDAAYQLGFEMSALREFFDDGSTTPRILAFMFRKPV